MPTVDELYDYVAKSRGVSKEEAKKQLHLIICGRSCRWYKEDRPSDFDPSRQGEDERAELERLIREAGFDDFHEARRLVHVDICKSDVGDGLLRKSGD